MIRSYWAELSQWRAGYESLVGMVSRETGDKIGKGEQKNKDIDGIKDSFMIGDLPGCLYVYGDKPAKLEKYYVVEERNENHRRNILQLMRRDFIKGWREGMAQG